MIIVEPERARRGEPSLADLMARFWRARLFIAVGVLVGAMIAFVLLGLLTPHYKARMIVSPANPMDGAGVAAVTGEDNLFALRYVTQRMEASNSSDFLRFSNSFAGVPVAKTLLEREDIRQGLAQDKSFAFKGADMSWSPSKLAGYVSERVRLDPVGATPLQVMSYYHPDPEFAARFLTLLHGVTDNMIRQNIKERVDARVRYLKQAVAETRNPDHRRALSSLLLEQERLRMLVSIENAYTAEIVEPASSSYRAMWPDRGFVYAVCVFGGVLLGFLMFGAVRERR